MKKTVKLKGLSGLRSSDMNELCKLLRDEQLASLPETAH